MVVWLTVVGGILMMVRSSHDVELRCRPFSTKIPFIYVCTHICECVCSCLFFLYIPNDMLTPRLPSPPPVVPMWYCIVVAVRRWRYCTMFFVFGIFLSCLFAHCPSQWRWQQQRKLYIILCVYVRNERSHLCMFECMCREIFRHQMDNDVFFIRNY